MNKPNIRSSLAFLCILFITSESDCLKTTYKGYKVFRTYPQTSDQLAKLRCLGNSVGNLDFWSEPKILGRTVDIMIHKYIDDLAASYPQVAQVATIGTTYMNNPLKLIKLGTIRDARKPAIWIDGGIHAREWISPATATYFIEQLITGYNNNNSVIRTYLDNLDWYILPVANPDGYEYSHTNSRMWRKNRSFSGGVYGIFCRGVDLNRNFGFHWNQGGASNMACAENYAGPKAFSEEESRSIAKFVLSQKENIKFFVTMHSYGQFWMTPWGYTSELPSDYHDLAALANKGASAIKAVHGTSYTVGSSTNVLYTASGGADDWAKGGASIKYSYTMELRDKGRHGFFLPSSQIVATGQETWEGIKVLADALINGIKKRANI